MPIVIPKGRVMAITYNNFNKGMNNAPEIEKFPPSPCRIARHFKLPEVVALE
jgi:hypothetical protein